MLPTNTKKDKNLVCCKACAGKGYKKKVINLSLSCTKCASSGFIDWIDNLKSEEYIQPDGMDRVRIKESIFKLTEEIEALSKLLNFEVKCEYTNYNGTRKVTEMEYDYKHYKELRDGIKQPSWK